jgi:hypothetical protein
MGDGDLCRTAPHQALEISSNHNSWRVFVWLVHGTYGRGFFPKKRWPILGRPKVPIWSEPGSPFREALARELCTKGIETDMMAFHWSGANSVQERDASAHQLAASLDANALPRLSQVIIGHSHGGTIALTAAEHYRKKPGEVLVVTLATPFIDMFPRIDRKDPDHDKQVTRYHNLQLGKTRLMGFLAGLLSYFAIKTVMPGAWTGSFSISYLVIGLLSTVYAIIFNNIYGKHADSLNEVPPPYGSTCNPNAVRLLVVRGTEDEAALALAAGAIQSLLASRVVRVTGLLLWIVGTFWATILYYLGDMRQSHNLPIIFLGGIVAAAAFYILMSAVEAVGRWVFGREFFFTGQIYAVNVNSAPDFTGDISIHTLPGQTGKKVTPLGKEVFEVKNYKYRRRHSLYEQQQCVELIADWVSERIRTN